VCSFARFGDPGGWRDRAELVRATGATYPVADTAATRWFTPSFQNDPIAKALIDDLRGTVVCPPPTLPSPSRTASSPMSPAPDQGCVEAWRRIRHTSLIPQQTAGVATMALLSPR
jgi:hypothetical protein